ncbi:hypothetical protein GLO73106DRAFT_00027050, partial [Gloeocapsa sp. PCC 73106]
NPTGDTTVEPNETAILTLSTGTGYSVGSPNAATGTITNDDATTNNRLASIVARIEAVSSANQGIFGVSSALNDILTELNTNFMAVSNSDL